MTLACDGSNCSGAKGGDVLEIPEDVMRDAYAVHHDAFKEGAPAIARAILAERKRCADVARRFVGYAEGPSGNAHSMDAKSLAESAASWISEAIESAQ